MLCFALLLLNVYESNSQKCMGTIDLSSSYSPLSYAFLFAKTFSYCIAVWVVMFYSGAAAAAADGSGGGDGAQFHSIPFQSGPYMENVFDYIFMV